MDKLSKIITIIMSIELRSTCKAQYTQYNTSYYWALFRSSSSFLSSGNSTHTIEFNTSHHINRMFFLQSTTSTNEKMTRRKKMCEEEELVYQAFSFK